MMYQRFDSDGMDNSFDDPAYNGFSDEFDAWDDPFDEFDLLEDGDFDAASPNIRQQRARAEQQRRRRLAQQQRRSHQQRPRQQRQPISTPTPTREPTLLERGQAALMRGVQAIHDPRVKNAVQALGGMLGLSSNPTAQTVSTAIGALVDSMPADEFEAENAISEAAPTIARLTVNSIMPGVADLPAPMRNQIIRSVTSATRILADRQGTQAARAIPQIVATIQRNAQQHRLPVRALPQAIRRTAAKVASSPGLTRQLSQTPSRGQVVRQRNP